ncbi:ABC transporter ATP-binding protein [Mesorhizobium sophorae]|uniref:dipeptide ABC transporter ATP-binding protein n=1 Tax=Mesorhizobium sophorae TaxID=1300294 RepID=UPI000BA335C3|nr:ABC transporter ATP-binding protein [Mesorhizobium sophorae]
MSASAAVTANPQTMTSPLLSVKRLRIERRTAEGLQTLVSGVELTVQPGETIGIVGESGSGKSITTRAITGLLPPGLTATGEIRYAGRSLLGLRERDWRTVRGTELGLILQDPFTMLNPIMRCERILGESLRNGGTSWFARREEAIRRLAEVGIHDASVIDRYPFQLSGGMRQRVAIAAALARDPSLLIADEPSTALDVTTQREILALLRRIQVARGMSLILITHDLRVAFAMCDRIYVMYAGSLVEVAPADKLDAEPLHPYSNALLLSEPPVDRRVAELVAIPGSVPSPGEVANKCVFVPRCQWAQSACHQGSPLLREVMPGRLSACIRVDEIRGQMTALRRQSAEAVFRPADTTPRNQILQAHGIQKVFGGQRHPVVALDNVFLEVREGESVGLVGESGSGKTTLSRVLVGLEHATAGNVTVGGVNVADWRKLNRKDLATIRRTVQVVFQDPYSTLNPMRSIGWTLAEAITTHKPDTRQVDREVEGLLEAVGLPTSYAQRRPAALSGGMRQRVAIARALAARPRVLICDEPVSALDVSVQAQILNLLNRLRAEREIAYLFITHDLSIVRQVTERIYVMHRGRVVESGTTDDVLNHPQDPYTVRLLASAPTAERDWLDGTR